MKSYLLILVVFLVSLDVCAGADSPQKIAEAYCQSEINADEKIRAEIIDVTRVLRPEIAKSKLPMKAMALDYLSEPVIVIDSCKVLKVDVYEKNATAVLVTSRLAVARGEGANPSDRARYFIRDKNPEDKLEVNMELVGDVWKIIYPPFPRVGVDALIKLYEEDLTLIEKNLKDVSKSQAQKNSILYKNIELDFLKNVK